MKKGQSAHNKRGTVHVMHCIDTEGPLHESVEATFERLRWIFHLDLEPRAETLRKLQRREIPLNGLEEAVSRVVAPELLAYLDTWDKVDDMLADAMSPAFRRKGVDSAGEGWVYNWFCVDHVDYEMNPRRRDIGYHNVYDHYRSAVRDLNSPEDGLHFHFHPHNFRLEAHRCATHWTAASPCLFQILSRRVLDRMWFPAAHRPGFHVIRPDSHWFLEQYVPFDFSNQSFRTLATDAAQFGVKDGRFGDWRRAPRTWAPYHPSHDDYQVPGDCRRWVGRCLNVGTRYRLIEESDVRQAFEEAARGEPVVMGFTNHDYRDLRPDVETVRSLIDRVAPDFPGVDFRFSEAIDAMRGALKLTAIPPCELKLEVRAVDARTHVIEVSSEVPTFGPQPWLALKTVAGTYHHDNFDIDWPHHRWRYVLDEETFPLSALAGIGVAANNAIGITTVSCFDPVTGTKQRRVWNEVRS